MFYVYEWYNKDNQEIFYVGKGIKNRYKQIKKRNKLFKEYYNNHNCDVRIIKYFESEEEAFKYENIRILELKSKNLCFCNLDNGGIGGCNFVWTPEMKEYYSKYNIMKSENQRKRMSDKNPMKDKEIAKIVGEKHKKAVIINGKYYKGCKDASKELGVWDITISRWCKRGYDTKGNPCYYANEKPKEYNIKTTNSKKVIIDNIKFNSIKEASEYLGVWSESLIRAIKNNRKCKGHICKYDNQKPSANLKDL